MNNNFNVSRLKNGLVILSYYMPYVDSVSVNLIAKVGSRYEEAEEEGISHFLEHMAFKGTNTRSAKQIAEEFDAIGGHFNAYTGYENTVYYSRMLSEHYEKALEIIADIIQNSAFLNEEIAKEYQVILQEIAHSQDNYDDLIYEKFYNTVYADQPLGRPILGTNRTLSTFNKEHFLKFINKHYNTQNLYLSVAGNITHDRILKSAEHLFSNIKQGEKSSFKQARYIGGYRFVQKELEQTTLIMGYEGVSYADLQQLYRMQLFSLIFGGVMSSRIFQQIREKMGLAYSVGSYNSAYSDNGVFTIYASTAHDKVELLIEAIRNEADKIINSVEEVEVLRAKTQLRSNILMAQEKVSYKAEEIGKNYSIFGRYISPKEIMEHITSIKVQDIVDIAYKVFSSKQTLAMIGPNEIPQLDKYIS